MLTGNTPRVFAAFMLPAVAVLPAAGQVVNEDIKLTADDPGSVDFFGNSVAVSGNITIIGAYYDDDGGSNSGSAYLFDTTTGQQLAKITASNAAPGDEFGFSVAISGTTAIVGARQNLGSGAAYLFDVTDPENPVERSKIFASDSAALDLFGVSVAIDGDYAVVGASGNDIGGRNAGSAYLFDVSDLNNPTQLQRWIATDRAAFDSFGEAVAISGTTALVGADDNDDAGDASGSVYVFDFSDLDNISQVETRKLTAADAGAGDGFGGSVGISGVVALVGSDGDDDRGSNAGAAYLFDVTNGNQLSKITAGDGIGGDRFGDAVAIAGRFAIVGAIGDDDGATNSGSAYRFDVSDPQSPILESKLLPSDPRLGYEFGDAVATEGAFTVVGVELDDVDFFSDAGSAYIFESEFASSCNPADLAEPFEQLDLADLAAFIDAFVAQQPAADINSDGAWDLIDINEFIAAFVRGCDESS